MPALVTHEEVQIWAEGEEVEWEPRKLDDWEIAERKAPRQAKIVAVPLAKFNTCAHRLFLVMFSANKHVLGHYPAYVYSCP